MRDLAPPAPPVTSGRTSGYAVASLVLGLLWLGWVGSVLAIVFGYRALQETSGPYPLAGRGMAYAGLILGWVAVAAVTIPVFVLR